MEPRRPIARRLATCRVRYTRLPVKESTLPTRIELAPGLRDLEELGGGSFEAWMGLNEGLATADRAVGLFSIPGESLVRLPLPGTPDEHGVRRDRPSGAGTGWVRVHRFDGRGAELLRARLTHPRSSSLAAREWNLICHLQRNGVGAPQLVALGERPGVLSSRSFLVTRELEGFEPLDAWLARRPQGRERRLGLRALGIAFGALFRCGAWLPGLGLGDVHLSRAPLARAPEPGECAASVLEELQASSRVLRGLRLKRVPLPSVAFTGFRRGRILPRVSRRRRLALLQALGKEAAGRLTPLECARVLALAANRKERGGSP
jgi:hypothetical protein